jgi:hypothetical protein
MEKVLKIILVFVILSVTCTSCEDVSQKVKDKIDPLMNETKSIDSLLTNDVEKVLTLDSLIDKSSTKVDSVVNKIIKTEKK